MEATKSDWILVRCECRFAKPAATIVACSTRAHRRLCATVLRVHMGCTRLAMFATNMAEPAQQATSSQVCSNSITAFATDPTPRCCAGLCLWISSWVSRPNAGCSQRVTRESRLPDDVTLNNLQPRMLCAMCDHRGADVSPSRLHHG